MSAGKTHKWDDKYLTIENVQICTPGSSVSVKFKNGDVVHLSSDQIRYLKDREFAKYIDKSRQEQLDHIGEKVQKLRKKDRLSLKACATTAKVSVGKLRSVERGRIKSFVEAAKIALKIFHSHGYSTQDFCDL